MKSNVPDVGPGRARLILILFLILGALTPGQAAPQNARLPANDRELRYWLENMAWHHQFTLQEMEAATGLSPARIRSALERFGISSDTRPTRSNQAPLLTLPYPGGRHPRIGFLDGAIDPQRETKISVFTPWDPTSYAVLDIPEAIWSNLDLTYLAHTHIPTVWTKQEITLENQEWERRPNGILVMERRLPNGISFGTRVQPGQDAVRMEMWLKNGSQEPLSDLRVQNCVMLKGARGFSRQTNDNKVIRKPFVAVHNEEGRRWMITAWEPCHRPWANAPCPCLHSDPKFPDCPPGQTRQLRGWFSFYEGVDIIGEFNRLESIKALDF